MNKEQEKTIISFDQLTPLREVAPGSFLGNYLADAYRAAFNYGAGNSSEVLSQIKKNYPDGFCVADVIDDLENTVRYTRNADLQLVEYRFQCQALKAYANASLDTRIYAGKSAYVPEPVFAAYLETLTLYAQTSVMDRILRNPAAVHKNLYLLSLATGVGTAEIMNAVSSSLKMAETAGIEGDSETDWEVKAKRHSHVFRLAMQGDGNPEQEFFILVGYDFAAGPEELMAIKEMTELLDDRQDGREQETESVREYEEEDFFPYEKI